MGAEERVERLEPLSDAEALLQLKEQIFNAWHQLPAEHQATITLALVSEVMAGEQGAWLRGAIALQWPAYMVPHAGAAGLMPEDEPPLGGDDESDFEAWLQKADRFVYDTVGCSIHDLPDCDYYNMWRDGAPPAEAADTALAEAGFDPFA